MAGYTQRQGQYLAFIHAYTTLHRRPPAEADIQAYFGVSAPSVHQMVVALEGRGFLQRTPRQARSIRVLLPPEELPDLEGHAPAPSERGSFEATYPHIAAWVARYGHIELSYDPYTDSYVRAIDEGGMPWGGGNTHFTLDENLWALEEGIREFMIEQGFE